MILTGTSSPEIIAFRVHDGHTNPRLAFEVLYRVLVPSDPDFPELLCFPISQGALFDDPDADELNHVWELGIRTTREQRLAARYEGRSTDGIGNDRGTIAFTDCDPRQMELNSPELRKWKRNLKLSARPEPRPRDRDLIWQESLRAWVRDCPRLVEPHLLRLS